MINTICVKYCLLFSITILLTTLARESSADWKESLNDSYQKLRQKVQSEFNSAQAKEQQSSKNTEISSPPFKIPDRWKVTVDEEPVFSSELYIVETGLANKQTIVLIHGLGQAGFKDWLNVIPELEKDYHVLALDLPGFGRSSAPDGRYSPTNYAKVIHWLVGKYAKERVIVVGHSMGAAVALRYTSDFPAQVKKLILVDAAGILERTAFVKHFAELPIDVEQVPNKLQRISAQVKDFSGSLIELSTVVPDITKLIDSSDLIWGKTFSGSPNLNAAMALPIENFSHAIRTLPHETTIIWGRLDNVAPLRTGEMLAGRLSHASLHVIETSQHVPMSSNPKEFNQLLINAITTTQGMEMPPKRLPSQGDLICNNENGITYRGWYDTVVIENCTGITLVDLWAKNIIIKNSVLEFKNVHVEAANIALSIYESVIVATNSTFHGDIGIQANGSRLDLAGISVTGGKNAIEIGDASRFIFSVSDLSSNTYSDNVHGVFRYRDTSLDAVLADRKN